jgi:hypothetical protein
LFLTGGVPDLDLDLPVVVNFYDFGAVLDTDGGSGVVWLNASFS